MPFPVKSLAHTCSPNYKILPTTPDQKSERAEHMLHTDRVLKTLYYSFRRRLRVALNIPKRSQAAPVLGQPLKDVLQRHSWILRSIINHGPDNLDLHNKAVCEVGAGDCLASTSYFLAQGASHVDIIEVEPPVVNEKQLQVLSALKQQGFPIDLSVILNGSNLDPARVTYHRCYMEQFNSSRKHQFIFSFSVMEHVEDLAGFYQSCWRTLNPGGWMLHMVDLGGHELFEDPLPPLDYQTYPDWLYDLMFPKYARATRRFLEDHKQAVRDAGFTLEKITPTRLAENDYLDQLWPKLRKQAKHRPREELKVIEFALLARKPL